MTHRQLLKALLAERSILFGNFTLASGAQSDHYIDARLTTMCAQGQLLVGYVAYEAIRESGLDPTHVGGLTLGADPVTYAIAHRSALEEHPIDGFTVRKKAKDHGTAKRVEGGLEEGDRCLLIEDTMTTGRSTLQAVEAVNDLGAIIVGVLTLVNRSATAESLYADQGLPLISLFTGQELLEAARADR